MITTGKSNWQWTRKFGMRKLPDRCEDIMRDELGFEPDDLDKYEIAKQRVANFTDDPAWNWLAPAIDEGKLSWSAIFDLVALNLPQNG